MDKFPKTLTEYLKCIARETARMSYPGRMSGLVEAGTKSKVEQHFVASFPMQQIWDDAPKIALRFDEWHHERVLELSQVLDVNNCVKDEHNRSDALATKFLNTFMHQLMKCEPYRPLWQMLHLPLDRRVLKALSNLESPSLLPVKRILSEYKKYPYRLSYVREYIPVQNALWQLVADLNKRSNVEHKLKSRIELNLLWAGL